MNWSTGSQILCPAQQARLCPSWCRSRRVFHSLGPRARLGGGQHGRPGYTLWAPFLLKCKLLIRLLAGTCLSADNGSVLFPLPALLPFSLPPQVCPLIQAITSALSVDVIQNSISKSQPGKVETFPVQPSQGKHAALCPPHGQFWSGDPTP